MRFSNTTIFTFKQKEARERARKEKFPETKQCQR